MNQKGKKFFLFLLISFFFCFRCEGTEEKTKLNLKSNYTNDYAFFSNDLSVFYSERGAFSVGHKISSFSLEDSIYKYEDDSGNKVNLTQFYMSYVTENNNTAPFLVLFTNDSLAKKVKFKLENPDFYFIIESNLSDFNHSMLSNISDFTSLNEYAQLNLTFNTFDFYLGKYCYFFENVLIIFGFFICFLGSDYLGLSITAYIIMFLFFVSREIIDLVFPNNGNINLCMYLVISVSVFGIALGIGYMCFFKEKGKQFIFGFIGGSCLCHLISYYCLVILANWKRLIYISSSGFVFGIISIFIPETKPTPIYIISSAIVGSFMVVNGLGIMITGMYNHRVLDFLEMQQYEKILNDAKYIFKRNLIVYISINIVLFFFGVICQVVRLQIKKKTQQIKEEEEVSNVDRPLTDQSSEKQIQKEKSKEKSKSQGYSMTVEENDDDLDVDD